MCACVCICKNDPSFDCSSFLTLSCPSFERMPLCFVLQETGVPDILAVALTSLVERHSQQRNKGRRHPCLFRQSNCLKRRTDRQTRYINHMGDEVGVVVFCKLDTT